MNFISEASRNRLIDAMKGCEQTPGQSILQHGEKVRDFYKDIFSHIHRKTPLRYQWRLPEWIYDPNLLKGVPSEEMMAEYHLFHDVGKPYCRIVDSDGRQHFPNHAEISSKMWTEGGGNPEIARLIAQDMDIHLLKAEGVEAFADRKYATALILTGLSEVHANASMFGGIESTSFKIKWKALDKRGRAILKIIADREVMPLAA